MNMETYKYNSTFSLSEYRRIFTSCTKLGFASVCILVNIRQYSLRLQVLLYTYITCNLLTNYIKIHNSVDHVNLGLLWFCRH